MEEAEAHISSDRGEDECLAKKHHNQRKKNVNIKPQTYEKFLYERFTVYVAVGAQLWLPLKGL